MATTPPITHAELATMLIVESCVPMIANQKVVVRPTVVGVELPLQQRSELGLVESLQFADGKTIFYPIPPNGVFFDIAPETATVWYNGADADAAIGTFEAALKQRYPKARFVEECNHPDDADMKVRFYAIDFDASRQGSIEVGFPKQPGGKSRQFTARVRGFRMAERAR